MPPLDWFTYQIHMPSPSKADGVGAGWAVVSGGGTVGGFWRASAVAGTAAKSANAAIRTRLRPCRFGGIGTASILPLIAYEVS